MNWFEVDRKGLAQQIARKGKAFVLFELYQNAIDAGADRVSVALSESTFRGRVEMEVRDNSEVGFQDLRDAYTLFAPSQKKGDPTLRGRFNIGEKFVLALCDTAKIASTTGALIFDDHGRHLNRRDTTIQGTSFTARLRATKAEMVEMMEAFRTIIPPPGVTVMLNGIQIVPLAPLATFEAPLQTEFSGEDGELRRTQRKTVVEIYCSRAGEPAMIYELGIPVVESGDKWHYNVLQRVPLTIERDNVPPSYLKALRTHALNAAHQYIDESDATSTWVREAAGDDRVEADTLERVQELRFGKKRVLYDPSDPEANKIAISQGYTLVYGGSQSREEHAQTKRFATTLPAGQVTPSPKPYSDTGDPQKLVPMEKWTEGMKWVHVFSQIVGKDVLGRKNIEVQFANDITWPYAATYGPGGPLTFNVGRLGHAWFSEDNVVAVLQLLLHEYAHEEVSDHLSQEFSDKVAQLGALLYVNNFKTRYAK